MARIVDHIPEPMVEEICNRCREPITLITKVDCDGSLYPACGSCGDCIENPWPHWRPDESLNKNNEGST